MKISRVVYLFVCLFPLFLFGQDSLPVPPPDPGGPSEAHVAVGGFAGGKEVTIRREMGKWWQDSKLAKQLQLSDTQITQLNQTFYDHRLKLIDYGAEMEKADLKLQNLLDADEPNETQVGTQVDQVLAARGRLEREYTMMNLDLRKVLTVAQWKQLKTIREERGPGGNVFFYRKFSTGPGMDGPRFLFKKGPGAPDMAAPDMAPAPPMPPPPGPGGDDMF